MAHLKQVLSIPISDDIVDHLHWSPHTVLALGGYSGGAVEVLSEDNDTVMGVLVYFPAVSLDSMVIK